MTPALVSDELFQLKSSRALWRQHCLVTLARAVRLNHKLHGYRDAYYKQRRDAFETGSDNLHLPKGRS